MGGFGTWSLASACPNRFAAIAPICGGGDAYGVLQGKHGASSEVRPAIPQKLADMPIWAFHGAAIPLSH